MKKSDSARPMSWCMGGCRLSTVHKVLLNGEEGIIDRDDESSQLPRGVLVRSTSFQALHSALARLYRLDDFSLEGIGQGFFSEVYKARHRVTGEIMVLKMNKLISNRHNMLREVELMNRLHHPNILSYYGVCVHEGQLHSLTEYINGGSLDSLIQNHGTELPWITRVSFTLDMAKGMDYLHCKNVFHRDLTSKNVLIKLPDGLSNQNMKAVIADFGLAAPIPQDKFVRLRQVGSPYWMAPEVIRGEWYDHRVDIFSFGIIICEIIARCEADPDILPRTNNFGIHYLAFSQMCQNDCPPFFLETAFQCCQIDPDSRPSFYELSKKLEKLSNSLIAAAEHRLRKHKVCHRRSFSDESLILQKNQPQEGNGNIRLVSNLEVAVGTPQEVLERISAADPYFQPSSATVNPFNKVKLPAKSQLIIEEGGRCCHSMPDLRNLYLCQPSLSLPSISQLASSDNSLNQGTPSLCHCGQSCNNESHAENSECISYQNSRKKPKSTPNCKCDICECSQVNKNSFKGNCRLVHGIWFRDTYPRIVCRDVDGSSGTSPRSDTGGGANQLNGPCIGYMRRRGSGESGFFSVEDMERASTPELCLSFSELSTASVMSTEDEDLYDTPHVLVHRSSSVVTDSSEDLSSLGCCHDQNWDLSSQPDDERSSRFLNSEYTTDIKSIVEFFERGYGSIRPGTDTERSRRIGVVTHRKERLVPLLRSKFSSNSNRSAYRSPASPSLHSKQLLTASFAQTSSSKSFNTKDNTASFRQGTSRQIYSKPERKDGFRIKDKPKFYITEGTVRAKRTIFESK